MTNVLYIYGYGSSPESRTCLALKEIPNANVISVHYDQTDPEVAVSRLVDAVRERNIDLVIGSSLGGWLAMHVCARTGKPCILINPLTDYTLIPTLRYVSDGTAFYGIAIDNYREFKINHPLFFPTMIGNRWQVECWDNSENGDIAWMLLSDSDEVIKYEEDDYIYTKEHSLELMKENMSNITIVKNGKHRLTHKQLIENVMPAYEKLNHM